MDLIASSHTRTHTHTDLVSVRQLIAILQCGDDDDPEDDKASATTRTKANADTAKPESADKSGRKGATQARGETKRGAIKRRVSIKKKKKRRKPGPTDDTSKQRSQVVLSVSGILGDQELECGVVLWTLRWHRRHVCCVHEG